MNIQELLNSGANVTIAVTPADLKEFSLQLINETAMLIRQERSKETYLSQKETVSLLGVSVNTLWRWERENYLVPQRVGRKPCYKMSDIEALKAGC